MVLTILIGGIAHPRLLIISDIDDTIKISHVRGKTRGFTNAFRTQNVFPGMPKLYQEILKSNPASRFYYVSNAPETFMRRSHQQFLDENKFPPGLLKVRNSINNENFKLENIRALVKELSPKTLILIGDSAENDSEIYEKIRQEFSQIKQHIFIRQVHPLSKNESPNFWQQPFRFVSPLEVSLKLKQLGVLTENQVRDIEISLSSELKESLASADSPQPLFPSWVKCNGFSLPDLVKKRETEEARLLAMTVEHHCYRK